MFVKTAIIKKLKEGKYRLYGRKKDKSGKRRDLGTFTSLDGAKKHEREVEYFKHQDDNSDDTDDKETNALSQLSDIAGFLEKAGYIKAADKVYMAMDAVDGSFADDDADYLLDSIPDNQLALPGSMDYTMTGEVAGGTQGIFSIPEAEKIASLANKLDEKGLHDEADEIDEILNIIKELQEKTHKPKLKEEDKEGVGVMVDSNGHVPSSVSQTSGFSGLSDAYFYSHYGNLEGAYGPVD